MIYFVADTHGESIIWPIRHGDTLIHVGDYVSGPMPPFIKKILVRGNHDSPEAEAAFLFACDGLLIENLWITHEPVERLPKGAHINVCGHLHDNHWPDYGFERKPFHFLLKPGEVYDIDTIRRRHHSQSQ